MNSENSERGRGRGPGRGSGSGRGRGRGRVGACLCVPLYKQAFAPGTLPRRSSLTTWQY